VISRVASSCFWLARYFERVDSLARLLGVNQALNLDVELPETERWRPLVVVTGQEEDFLARFGEEAFDDGETVQQYLTWDEQEGASIYSGLQSARENARTVRETMSVEMWEAINAAWLWLGSPEARRLYETERDAFYDHLSKECMLFHGICYSTMLHDEAFVFMKLGRAVERVGQTARVLDVKHQSLGFKGPGEDESATDAAQWLAILRSCSAFDPFFKKAARVLSGPSVAEFLIFEPSFPRSVVHNLDRTRGLLLRIREGDPPGMSRRCWNKLERFRGSLVQMTARDVQKSGVHEVLTWIVENAADLCQSIHDDFLDPPLEGLRDRVREERRARPGVSSSPVG